MLARIAKLEEVVLEQQSYLDKQEQVLGSIWSLLTDSQVPPASSSLSTSQRQPERSIPSLTNTKDHSSSASLSIATHVPPSSNYLPVGGKRKTRAFSLTDLPPPPSSQENCQPPPPSSLKCAQEGHVVKKSRTDSTDSSTPIHSQPQHHMDKPVHREHQIPHDTLSDCAKNNEGDIFSPRLSSSANTSTCSDRSREKSASNATVRKLDSSGKQCGSSRSARVLRNPSRREPSEEEKFKNSSPTSKTDTCRFSRDNRKGRDHDYSHCRDSKQGLSTRSSSRSPRKSVETTWSPGWGSSRSPRQSGDRHRPHVRNGSPPRWNLGGHEYQDDHREYKQSEKSHRQGDNFDSRVVWNYPNRDKHSGWRSTTSSNNISHSNNFAHHKSTRDKSTIRRVIVDRSQTRATGGSREPTRGGGDKQPFRTSSDHSSGVNSVGRPIKKYFNVDDDSSSSRTSPPKHAVAVTVSHDSGQQYHNVGGGHHGRLDSGTTIVTGKMGQWRGSASSFVVAPVPVHKKCFCGWCAHCTGAAVK